ncbi:MAG: hypothetical protein IPP73_19680 [Chitinophagaceae bacterium]|nr:hypothetical protein [Chitinophagaceae bacterium]
MTLTAAGLQYSIDTVTDEATTVNLSYHPYFNLDENSSTVNEQKAKIHAAHWLEQDDNFLCYRKINCYRKHPYDFRNWQPISQLWNKADGYDQSFVADKTMMNFR